MLFRGRVGFKTFKYSTTKEKSIPTCDAHTPFTPRQTYRSKKTQTERKTITVNSIIEIAQCFFFFALASSETTESPPEVDTGIIIPLGETHSEWVIYFRDCYTGKKIYMFT